MSASAAIVKQITEVSPRLKARLAGALYLISGMAFSYSENTVRGKLVVFGDAAATAHNILANENLYRLAFIVELLPLYLVVTFMLYDLLKPVNRSLSLLAFVFSIVGCTMSALTCLLHFAPLAILGGSPYSTAFTADQLQALALVSLKLGAQGTNIMMVFFGFYCMLIGYLILRSAFLPRIIGALLLIAGLSYQINSFANFLSLPLASYSFRYIAMPAGGLGEGSLMLWLLVMGVNTQRWKEQASVAVVGA